LPVGVVVPGIIVKLRRDVYGAVVLGRLDLENPERLVEKSFLVVGDGNQAPTC
jgi:hypothetical protein